MAGLKKDHGLIERLTITASSGGSLSLANNSRTYQQITGTLAHTIVLPQANSASPNDCPVSLEFTVMNRSSGVVTVNYFGGSLAKTLAANTQATFRLVDNSTSTGTWDITNEAGSGSSVVSLSSLEKLAALAGLANSLYQDSETDSMTLKVSPEEIGGNYWLTKAPLPLAKSAEVFTLNGFTYAFGGVVVSEQNGSHRYSDDANFFLVRTNIPVAKYDAASFTLGGFGYHMAGQNNAQTNGITTNNAYKYTDSTDTWSILTDITTPCRSCGSGAFDLGYVIGGVNGVGNNRLQSYNTVSNAWLLAATLPQPVYYPASFANKEKLHFAGGSNGGASIQTNYAWDAVLNTIFTKKAMAAVRQTHGSASLGQGFAMGGYDTGYIATSEKYTFETDSWQSIANKPSATQGSPCGGATLNGNVIIFGAYGPAVSAAVESHTPFSFFQVSINKKSSVIPTSIFAASALNAIATSVPVRLRTDGDNWKHFESNKDGVLKLSETLAGKFQYTPELYWAGGTGGTTLNNKFDDISNSWIVRQALPVGVQSGGSFAIDGYGFSLIDTGTELANQRYDSIANSWTTRAAILDDNEFGSDGVGWTLDRIGYYAGGESDDATNDSLQSYNNTTNVWTQKTSTTNPHRRAVGFSLFDSHGFCGNSITGLTTNIERYNPISNAWTSVTDITNRRDNAAGAELNGKGYVIGGSSNGASANAQNSIYEYNHNSNSWTTKTVTGYNLMFFDAQASNGEIFWAGGLDSGGSTLGSTRRFNPEADTVTTRTALTTASSDNRSHPSGSYRNYQLQVGLPTYLAAVGGDAWTINTAILPVGAEAQIAISLESKVFLVGGTDFTATTPFQTSVVYNSELKSVIGSFPNYNSGQYRAQGMVLNGRGLIMGGNPQTGATNVIYRLNPITGFLNTGTTMTYSMDLQPCTTLNGYGYSFTGYFADRSNRYDESTNSITDRANANTIRGYSLTGHVLNGFGYIAAGLDNSSSDTNVVERYNDSSNVWTTIANLSGYTGRTPSRMNQNQRYLVMGGGSNNNAEYLDGANVWIIRREHPVVLNSVATGSVNGEGYTFGGRTAGGPDSSAIYQFASTIKNIVLGAALRIGN